MATTETTIRVYQELASLYDGQGQAQVRDRFLVLAADAALSAGRLDEAEALRAHLLQMNPHHLLKPFASVDQALQSVDVKTYVEGLRRTYAPDAAVQLLGSLKKDLAGLSQVARPQAGGAAEDVGMVPLAPVPARSSPPLPARPPAPAATPEAPIPFAPEAKPHTSPVAPAAVESVPMATIADRSESASDEEVADNWLASALFYVVLAASISLGIYTLVRPFL